MVVKTPVANDVTSCDMRNLESHPVRHLGRRPKAGQFLNKNYIGDTFALLNTIFIKKPLRNTFMLELTNNYAVD